MLPPLYGKLVATSQKDVYQQGPVPQPMKADPLFLNSCGVMVILVLTLLQLTQYRGHTSIVAARPAVPSHPVLHCIRMRNIRLHQDRLRPVEVVIEQSNAKDPAVTV